MVQIHTEEGKCTESFIERGILEWCKENEAEVETKERRTHESYLGIKISPLSSWIPSIRAKLCTIVFLIKTFYFNFSPLYTVLSGIKLHESHKNELWKYFAKWKKPDTKDHMLYDSVYLRCPKQTNP